MVRHVKVRRVGRILYSIFQRFTQKWKTAPLNLFTQGA